VAGTLRQMTGEITRRRPRVVINTIGPFVETTPLLATACMTAGSDYVDIANDVGSAGFLLSCHERAVGAGRTLVTGAGFGVTATESVVVKLCENRPAAARVRVDMVPSVDIEAGPMGEALAGTIVAGLPGAPGGGRYAGRRYEHGRLVRAPIGADPESLTLPDGSRVTTAGMPLGELLAAQRASGADWVLSASSEAPSSPAVRAIMPLAGALLSIGAVRGFAQRRLARVQFRQQQRPREHSWGHARIEWADGTKREGWLRTGEAQAFTGAVCAAVTARLAAGGGRPGAYTPAALFGTSLAETCGGAFLTAEPDVTAVGDTRDGQR